MRHVKDIIPARQSLLPGGFVVYRALPRRQLSRVGGFVFLDHFDQPDISPEMFDVPPHPHIGLQTVTYLFEGSILHNDSLDHEQMIFPGEVNWMTAGRGITHSEQVVTRQPRLHGLQTWVGLPHDKRKVEPGFEHFGTGVLPALDHEGVLINVIAGELFGRRSPIPTHQSLVYLDIRAHANSNAEFSVEGSHELAVYVCEGTIQIGGEPISKYDLASLSAGEAFGFSAVSDARFVLFGGEPLHEPTVIYWNFIADSIEEAKQAERDWESGNFPSVSRYRSSAIRDESDRTLL